MKIRKGFVSNSSSCSFVVVGYRTQKDETIWERMFEKFGKQEWEDFKEKYYSEWKSMSNSEKREAFYEMMHLIPFDIIDNDEDGYKSNTHMIIGEVIATSDDEYMEQNVIQVNESSELDETLIGIFKELDMEYEKVVLTGTKMC